VRQLLEKTSYRGTPAASRTIPGGTRWAFEIKHDDFRLMCRHDGERVRVPGSITLLLSG